MAILVSIRWIAIIFVALIAIFISIAQPTKDPVDNQLIKNFGFVDDIRVVDENVNGFRVIYTTTEAVTPDRLSEIRSRQHIRDSLDNLKCQAPVHFGDMLYTDIYDFAEYATQYDPMEVRIHNIFVVGRQKQSLYVGPNPAIRNPAKYINPSTLQGVPYLKSEDIYCRTYGRRRIYRYWQCSALHQTSDYDEHFSHFSEDERLY